MRWLDHGNTGTGIPLLERCADLGGGKEAGREVERLWAAVESGPDVEWEGHGLCLAMKACRRTGRGLDREAARSRSALPPLNPGP